MDLSLLGIVFIVGIVAGFLGGFTSGAGNLISIPFLIFLGLPPQVAIATDRFGSLGYVASTLHAFSQSKKIVYAHLKILIILSIIGGAIGASLIIHINKDLLTHLIGLVIIILLPLIIWKKDLGVKKKKIPSQTVLIVGFFLYFLSALYDGFLGAAGRILVAYLLVFLFGISYTKANATEKVPYAFNAIISLVIFAAFGIINYMVGIALLLGELLGAYIGAHQAIQKGDKVVRIVMIIVVAACGIKLLVFPI